MHPYLLIPLAACMGASAMASAVVARDPKARASRLGGYVMACTALWALLDFAAHLYLGADAALPLVRLAYGSAVLLPPLFLELVLEPQRERHPGIVRCLPGIWVATALVTLIQGFTGLVIEDVRWTDWGWRTELGPLFLVPLCQGLVCGAPTVHVLLAGEPPASGERDRTHELASAASGVLLVAAVFVSEFVLPVSGVAAPRLGALGVTAVGALLWALTLRSSRYVPPPSEFARQVLDTLEDGVALIGHDGRIRAANRSLASLRGASDASLDGVEATTILSDPLDPLPEEIVARECLIRDADGQAIPVSLSITSLRDPQGSKLGSVWAVRDLRDVVELRRRLVTAGRLAAVGELAAGIAHEVNNPIAYIQSNLYCLHDNDARLESWIGKELPGEAVPDALRDGSHLIGQCLQEIGRVATIVHEVRGFSHMGPESSQWIDVNTLIESALRIAMPQLRRSARVIRDFAELPHCFCAGQSLKQVFLDLILSGVRSIDGSGTIHLSTALEGDSVLVRVVDDGGGISSEHLERIFDPAFAHGQEGEPGPDFSVSYQIVRQHGGDMIIESPPGLGTLVSVRIPIAGSQATDAWGEPPDAALAVAAADEEAGLP